MCLCCNRPSTPNLLTTSEENMHAYRELSRTIGEDRRAIESMEPGGTEPSYAGKMKSRCWSRNNRKREPKFLQVMAGHKDYLSKHVL